jgi:glucoside 3-dehydrogenase (cytochrome c) hitch-hiker subunit
VDDDLPTQLSRRAAVGGAVAALVSLMLAEQAAARAAQQRRQDPRYAFISRLCDLVIPPTDTPGAAQTPAAEFVLLAIDHGMNDLDARSLDLVRESLQSAAGGNFLELAAARQGELLEALDARAFARSPSAAAGTPEIAWQHLKPAIIAGYYTSEIGASRELVYEPVPGPERANFVLTADYRSRSNEDFGGTL